MSAVDRRVDTDVPVDLTDRVGVGQQRGMDPVPGPISTEPAVPFPHRLPWSELTGQVPPGQTRPEPVDDPLHHLPVITKLIALLAIRGRHQRLDQLPLGIGQHGGTRHHTTIGEPTPRVWETRPSRTGPDPPSPGPPVDTTVLPNWGVAPVAPAL